MPEEVTNELVGAARRYVPIRTALLFRVITAPLVSLFFLVLALLGGERWRITGLMVHLAAAIATGVMEVVLAPRSSEQVVARRNAMFVPTFIFAGMLLTGGLRSPLASMVLPVSF